MTAREELASFIRSTFRSVWSLELLVHLSDTRDRSWSREQLVTELRASELIVSQSLDTLIAVGLVSIDQNGCARFSPASAELERLCEGAKALYAKSPDSVRRLIISTSTGGISAFANA